MYHVPSAYIYTHPGTNRYRVTSLCQGISYITACNIRERNRLFIAHVNVDVYANNGLLHFMIKHHVLRHLNFVNNLYDKIADEETRGKQVVNIKEALMVTPLINSIAQ